MVDKSFFYSDFPVIKLGDIALREISVSDAAEYYNYMKDPQLKMLLCADHIPKSLQESKEELAYWSGLFKLKNSIYWAICNKNDELIGTAGFNHISFKHGRAELSYDLAPKYWGRGYMRRTIEAILDFAKNEIQLTRVQATVSIDNIRSIKLLERCGFKSEGVLEKYEIVNKKYKDYFIFANILT